MEPERLVDRIDHIVVAVRDVEPAAPAMARLLGAAPSWQGVQPAEGITNVLFRLANTTLELLAPEGPAASTPGSTGADLEAFIEARGPGLYRLDFGTGDLDAVEARLASAGIGTSGKRDGLSHDDPSGAWRRFRVLDVSPHASRGIRTRIVEETSPADLVPAVQPISDDGSCVSRLDHVVVMTRDPDHALAFYGETLGLRLALDRTFEKRGVRLIFFRTGGLTLEIGSRLSASGELGTFGEAGEAADMLWGLAYQVPDADRARARIAEVGYTVSEVRDGHKPGTRVFTVEGTPLGVPSLVIQPPPDAR